MSADCVPNRPIMSSGVLKVGAFAW